MPFLVWQAVAEYVVVSLEGVFAVIKGLRDKSVVPAFVSSMRTFFATLRTSHGK